METMNDKDRFCSICDKDVDRDHTVEFCLSQPLQRIVLTDEYKRAIEISQAFKEHIWKNGVHRMRSEFDRASGTGHLYCISCHEVIWEDSEEEEEVRAPNV